MPDAHLDAKPPLPEPTLKLPCQCTRLNMFASYNRPKSCDMRDTHVDGGKAVAVEGDLL
jgi:hypothetical protein